MLVSNMLSINAVVFSVILSSSWCVEDLNFPPGFKFGVASSAYQVEGAWNASDKGESIWDHFVHDKSHYSSESTGDVACDSYHLWKRDIEMISELGVHFYRLSISWNRLLPTGFPNRISKDGKNYYNNLINGLLEKGIEPVITLYHWDLPLKIQNLGGWTNPLISNWFADYARVAYSLYADRVKTWITINEPIVICDLVYNTGHMAPRVKNPEIAPHLCNKHILIAHAKAWRIYDEEFKQKYHGRVSVANHFIWIEPEKEEDAELAELARECMVGRYSHAIYSKEGGWPPSFEKLIAEVSKKQGYLKSNLPAFTKEEIDFVKGTYDFFAVNSYTSRLIRKAKEGEVLRPWPMGDSQNLNAVLYKHPNWTTAASFWFHIYPEGMRRQLAWLKKQYGDINYIITENGFANLGGLNDTDRIEYYRDYLKQVLLAIKEDGVNVTGYTAWTLMDNFEWTDGYNSKFGLYEVDFSSPERTRTPRASAYFYRSIVKSHSLNVPVTIDELNRLTPETTSIWTNNIIYISLAVVVAVIAAAVCAWYVRRKNAASTLRRENYTSVKLDVNYD